MRDDLRRIEVKAVIELLEPPVHQHLHRIHRGVSCDVARLIDVLAVVGARLHALRTEDEHIAVAEREEIGTLPHIAEVLQLRAEFAQTFPTDRCLTVDEHAAALVLCLCTDDEVAHAAPLKEIGIAEMRRKARRRAVDDDLLFFDRARSLGKRAEPLHRAAVALLILCIAGIEDAQMPVLLRAAARVAAVLVVLVRRPERELRDAVGAEIPCLRVRP